MYEEFKEFQADEFLFDDPEEEELAGADAEDEDEDLDDEVAGDEEDL